MDLDSLRRLVHPIYTRISNLVRRGVIKRADDAKSVQELQIEFLPGEVRDEVERFGQYGFTSVPKAGAEAVTVNIGGRSDQAFCVGVEDRRYRPTGLAEGEVAVYNDTGAQQTFKANGDVEITPKPGQVVALGGQTNPVAKGDSLNSAIANLGTAIASALTTMGAGGVAPVTGTQAAAAGTSITLAVTAFNAAAAAALSTKVKLS